MSKARLGLAKRIRSAGTDEFRSTRLSRSLARVILADPNRL